MENYIRNLRIIWFAIFIWPLALLGIAWFIKVPVKSFDDSVNVFRYIVPALGGIFITIGYVGYRKRLIALAKLTGENMQLEGYRAAMIRRLAFIEGNALFSAVTYMITGDRLLAAFTLIYMLFYLPVFPSSEKISALLNDRRNS